MNPKIQCTNSNHRWRRLDNSHGYRVRLRFQLGRLSIRPRPTSQSKNMNMRYVAIEVIVTGKEETAGGGERYGRYSAKNALRLGY